MQSWTLSKLNSSLDLPSHHSPTQASGLWGKPKPRHVGSIIKSTTSMWQTLIFYIIALGACPISSLIPSLNIQHPPPWSSQGIGFINPKWSWWCWVSHLQISPRLCLPLLLIGKGLPKTLLGRRHACQVQQFQPQNPNSGGVTSNWPAK